MTMFPTFRFPGLHPFFKDLIDKVIAEAALAGIVVAVHSGLRDADQQSDLYALGRTKENPDGKTLLKPLGNIVTNARPYDSWHNFGLAADVVFKTEKGNWTWSKTPAEWAVIGEIGERHKLVWGGRWKMKDYPHFQYTGMLKNIAEAKTLLFEKGVEAVWSMI